VLDELAGGSPLGRSDLLRLASALYLDLHLNLCLHLHLDLHLDLDLDLHQ
jgi:hypothetical protein